MISNMTLFLQVLKDWMEKGNVKSVIALDLDSNENLSEDVLLKFIKIQGAMLKGLVLSGIPHLCEQFWASTLPIIKKIR